MKSNYNDCLNRLLKDEGGYCNDPGDNGGPTKYGITIFDVRKYVNKTATAQDVKALTLDQAKAIYKSKYWDALDCDNLPSGVDYSCFDYGVNSGLGRPRKALERFKSLQGIQLIDAINDERMAFLRAIGKGHNAGFLRGWTARVSRVRAYSKQLATGKPRDPTSGPIAGGVAGLSLWATFSQYIHSHPYTSVAIAAMAGLAVAVIIHIIRNK